VRSKTDCAVTIAQVALTLADGTRATGEPAPLDGMKGRSLRYLWTPVRFDGDPAWNDGARAGTLDVTLAIGGVAQAPASFPLAEEWHGVFP
jgi:hypothetical protein